MTLSEARFSLPADELVVTIKALTTSIASYAYWSITPGHPFRTIDFYVMQRLLNGMVQVYTKLVMVLQASAETIWAGEIPPALLEEVRFSPAVWDVINELSLAPGWHDVTVHMHPSCPVCSELVSLL